MTKMENFAGSRKVAHILKVWSLLSIKYLFRQDRWKIRRWWVILPRHFSYLLILQTIFFQSCNLLVILYLFDSLHRDLSEKQYKSQ